MMSYVRSHRRNSLPAEIVSGTEIYRAQAEVSPAYTVLQGQQPFRFQHLLSLLYAPNLASPCNRYQHSSVPFLNERLSAMPEDEWVRIMAPAADNLPLYLRDTDVLASFARVTRTGQILGTVAR